jgi:sugar phosphate isomerase/epimerase
VKHFEISGFIDEAAVDLEGQLRELQRNGMSFVDVRQVDGTNVADFTPEKSRQVRAALDGIGVRVACVGSPIGKTALSEPFAPHVEKLRRVCATAAVLGTTSIRMFSFFLPEGVSRADCTAEVVDRLGRLLDVADAEGCTLLHENERDIYGETWEQCLELHRALGPRLRAVHDAGNYVLVGSDPLAGATALFDWIDSVHVKDARSADRTIVPPGAGDGRYPEILRLLATKPGVRFAAIEPHLTLFSGRDQLEKKTAGTPTAAEGFVYPDAGTAFSTAVRDFRALVAAVES